MADLYVAAGVDNKKTVAGMLIEDGCANGAKSLGRMYQSELAPTFAKQRGINLHQLPYIHVPA